MFTAVFMSAWEGESHLCIGNRHNNQQPHQGRAGSSRPDCFPDLAPTGEPQADEVGLVGEAGEDDFHRHFADDGGLVGAVDSAKAA